MKILLSKTGKYLDITWLAAEMLHEEFGWGELEFAFNMDESIESRSNQKMIEIIEELGEKAFLKTDSEKYYEIVELDIQEDELSDYVIAKVNGYEEVLKKTNTKTIKKIIGSVSPSENARDAFTLYP